jgi:hypothetical protein
MRASRLLPLLAVAVLAAVLAAPAGARHARADGHASGTSAPTVTVVAEGLRNPRHLDFGSHDDLYVAEAGAEGGSASCFDSAEGAACVSATGAVTRIADADDRHPGPAERIVDGLASFAPPAGETAGHSAIGPHGIFAVGHRVYVTNGGPTEPQREGKTVLRETLAKEDPVADLFGRLLKVRRHGGIERIADIWGFERDNNPDAQVGNPAIDSNAVDVLKVHGRFVVADAGGNTVLSVTRGGAISPLHVFPNTPTPGPDGAIIPMQTVPTGVVKGPDGYLYVSQLTGFPFPVGGAKVFVLDPGTGAIVREITGFTNAMDLAFGKDGTLYVLEIDADSLLGGTPDGAIFRVAPGASTGEAIALPPGTLTEPGGITVGDHGDLFVTNHSRAPHEGQVLRIRLDGHGHH